MVSQEIPPAECRGMRRGPRLRGDDNSVDLSSVFCISYIDLFFVSRVTRHVFRVSGHEFQTPACRPKVHRLPELLLPVPEPIAGLFPSR